DSPYDAPPAIAFDGANFLITWKVVSGDLHAMRVSPSGQALDAQPIVVATQTAAASSTVVWNGSAYVVAWIDQRYPTSGITPPIPVPAQLKVVRVAADGHVLDASPKILQLEKPGNYLGVAWNGSDLFALFNGDTCIWGAILNNDGTPRT